MKPEIEAKFLNIDIDPIRQKLEQAGAKLQKPMRLMRRVTIETPELKTKDAFVRVRDEGDKVTITYKQFSGQTIDGASEIEVEVNDFEAATALLAAAGLKYRSFQESRRETWLMDDVEIVIDEWPWLNTYIEIEGPTENDVRKSAEKLDFDWSQAVFGDVMAAYRAQYPHLTSDQTVGTIAEVKFGQPLPPLLQKPTSA